MVKKVVRTCPVCDTDSNAEVLHTQSFVLPEGHLLADVKGYDIVACNTCGFVYADTPASQKTYDIYYADMSKYEMDYSNVDIRRYSSQAGFISSFLESKEAKIVDMGCGNGGLLMALKELGYKNLTAVDPSEKCITTINSKGINANIGDIFKHNLKEKYDLIILSHVLEHIVDVGKAMKILVSMLNDNGLIYVEVPDASRYVDNYVVPFYYFDTEHINHFEEVSLINLGFRNSLSVKSLGKKMIEVGQDIKYPAIYSLYVKIKNPTDWKNSAREKVSQFIKQSREKSLTGNLFDEIINKQTEVIIWGAGNFTMRLLENTDLGKCNIIGFIDKDPKKKGQKILGKSVFSPDKVKELSEKTVIVVCSALYSAEICLELETMKIPNKIITLN